MMKIDENSVIENILAEFEKSNNQINETIRLQNELSRSENELMALQIRFVHKNKENEDLKIQLEAKNKLINERSLDVDCTTERYQSLEFHYNELLEKHKLCLECMEKQKFEMDSLEERLRILGEENKRLLNDKTELKELFSEQVNDLEINLKKLFEDNDKYVETIEELKTNSHLLQSELECARHENSKIKESEESIKKNFELLKEQYDRNMGVQCIKLDVNGEKINELQIDLSRANSKLDEAVLQLNEAKHNHLNEVKKNESLLKELEGKDLKYEELKNSYENVLYQIQSLNKINLKQKNEFETELIGLRDKSDLNWRNLENESHELKKQKKYYETILKNQILSYNNQQKLLEELVELYKKQTLDMKALKLKCLEFAQNFTQFKKKYKEIKNENAKSESQIKVLQEKCFDLESKYSEKCEHLNDLERENYVNRNSLESVMNDLNNLSNVISKKNEEIIIKNQTIDRLESIINQLNNEINKRKAEITERIAQIETLDKHLKEEKNVLDLKMSHLEANLKSKSKQLHQRIDQIKELSDVVNTLKEEKDQAEYKIQQIENMNKCQKLEIESKLSIIKQLELRIKDTKNELAELKSELTRKKEEEESKEIIKEVAKDVKETQTDEIKVEPLTLKEDKLDVLDDLNQNEDKLEIDELKLNIKIKDNLIESINDSLVLKEAEIARLKTRIAIMERKDIISELNVENKSKE
ncbi:unnamed protein product [Brachionus calyciflorus]|uniref:Uncharacterized protein n=1 Tax=Brachionus calyciflorus TaxID=104777 RepID=A0A813MQ00_9BILA|nr:unnamed protein product [Brachionus calyciflorus]